MKVLRVFISLLVLVAIQAGDAHARRQRRGTLVIESMTEGAKVYVDGRLIGKTPIEHPLKLRPGRHRLKATKAGYGTLDVKFTIRANKTTDVSVVLMPFSGLVKFTCSVDGAEVYVDNKLIGHTPLIRDVVVGNHKVMILKDGYNDYEADINVKAGEKHFVEASLSKFKDISPEVLAMAKAHEENQKEAANLDLEELARNQPAEAPPPWYTDLHKKWWVWAIAGAVVVTAVTVPLATMGGGQSGLHMHDDAHSGTIDLRP